MLITVKVPSIVNGKGDKDRSDPKKFREGYSRIYKENCGEPSVGIQSHKLDHEGSTPSPAPSKELLKYARVEQRPDNNWLWEITFYFRSESGRSLHYVQYDAHSPEEITDAYLDKAIAAKNRLEDASGLKWDLVEV